MKLSPFHTFGINGCIRDNIVVYNDSKGTEQVVFPVGSNLVAYDSETKSTSFFEAQKHQVAHNRPPTALAIAPSEKFIAISLSGLDGEGGLVVVFKTATRKKVISMLNRSRVKSMCFSCDTKHLICACEDSINVWLWENNKLDFSAAITGNITRVASSLSHFSPSTSLFVTSGKGHNRLWIASNRQRLSNTKLTQTETNESKFQYEDNAWLTTGDKEQDMLLAVIAVPLEKDQNGMLSVPCHQDSIVNIYRISDGISSSRPRVEHDQTVALELQKEMQATTITGLRSSPGFAIGATTGTILLYEYQEIAGNQKTYIKTRQISNGDDSPVVSILNRNIHDDRLMIYCHNRIDILNISEFEVADSSPQTFIAGTGHKEGIVDLDCCLEKPYIVTCGSDNTVKVWNHQQRKCLITHKSDCNETHTVAIHPSGHQLAVGFKDKLVLYHILIDGLKSYREMSCKSPVKIIAFSEGGRYLAVAIANGISVYSTFQDSDTSTFLLESCFIGHTGPVQCLTWAGGKLFSAGADRNIFGWDMHTGVRIDNFNVLRSSGACMSVAVATSCTLLRVATCTTDGALHKIEWSGRSADESSTTLLCGPSNENKITTVCLSQDKSTLFAATMNGVVKIYSWLSGDDPTHIVHQVALHCNYSLVSLQRSIPLVSRMMCSGPFLISTGGNDGSLMLSEYSSSQSPPRVPPPSIINEDIVLIRIDVYEETKELINELKRNIKTLKSDHDFELHSKEVIWKNIFSEQKDQAGETFIAERARCDNIEATLKETILVHKNNTVARDDAEKNGLQELEESNNRRLSDELSRYEKLQREMSSTQESLDDLLSKQKIEYEHQIQDIQYNADTETSKLRTNLQQLQQEAAETDKIFREVLDQQEEEYEMELVKLKAHQIEQLQAQNAKTQEAKSLMLSLNSKKDQLVRQNEELRSKATLSEDTFRREMEMRRKMQSDMITFETKVNDLEGNISKKEKELTHLSSQNQSLSLQKSVIETRSNEIENEKVPLFSQIEEMSKDTKALSHELKEKDKFAIAKELAISRNTQKMKNQEKQMKLLEAQVRTLKREFVIIGGLENDVEMKNAIIAAYKKYG